MSLTFEPGLQPLNRLAGAWTTEATHPALQGVVHGTVDIEWLEGEQFLILRARTDHPDFPDAISIIGHMETDRVGKPTSTLRAAVAKPGLSMHYFDSRGVFRAFGVSITDESWKIWRDSPGFSQRFAATFADGGDTILGRWQLCKDNVHWKDDLQITYRRKK